MDKIDEYEILNAVKPLYLRTQYPYNLVSNNQIVFTQKKITIMAKNTNTTTPVKKKGGYDANHQIIFYG
jgi:hypothetical protein